ncbi:DUF2147 domain-containing protein [Hyphomicrobium sp.]|uniref:DUF2147 domain-containing protein n=1 Tax=Hyphomicrobium sp. TaxID=82 RepID=UPI0025C48212|nr:DUF2147 domain-containing protein [Hyphomicrobium sp.]MCC7252956.1 DUF2147 domain-containing protein [Hyphomicrobium sp.]
MPFERQGLRFAALAAVLLGASPAFAAGDPTGVWVNDTGRGAIEIKDCGGKLCGHVVWVKDTSDANGCGRQIIGDLASAGSGVWGGDNAWIYSPEKKKKYNVEVTPLEDGTLKVKGYAGISFLSKTMIWTKAPADLQRCSTQEAAATPAPKAESAPAPATGGEKKEAAPRPPKDDETNVAEAEKDGVDLEGLAGEFGDVFTRKDGKCKVDTPWVKLDFDCKGK